MGGMGLRVVDVLLVGLREAFMVVDGRWVGLRVGLRVMDVIIWMAGLILVVDGLVIEVAGRWEELVMH